MTDKRKTNIGSRDNTAPADKRPKRVRLNDGTPMQDYFKTFHTSGYAYYSPIVTSLDDLSSLKRMESAWWDLVKDDSGEVVHFSSHGAVHVLMRTKQEYYDEDMLVQQDKVNASEGLDANLRTGEYIPKGNASVVTSKIEK